MTTREDVLGRKLAVDGSLLLEVRHNRGGVVGKSLVSANILSPLLYDFHDRGAKFYITLQNSSQPLFPARIYAQPEEVTTFEEWLTDPERIARVFGYK